MPLHLSKLFKNDIFFTFLLIMFFFTISSSLKCTHRLISTSLLKYGHKHNKSEKKDPCTGRPKPKIDFNCKIALITGGAEGIGFATAHELLSEKIQGVALVGTDNCLGREAVSCLNCTYGKNKAIFINCDVQSKIQIADCYEKVLKEFGRLDILVTADNTFNGVNWEKEIAYNLMGTIHNVYHASKIMTKECHGPGGVILTISGLHGIKPLYGAPTFSASYFGVVGFSRSLGNTVNFHRTGIRVMALCPGFTNSNLIKNMKNKAYNEAMGKTLDMLLCKEKRQNHDVCGKSAVHVMKYGSSGSVWVVDGSKLYSLHIPKWKKYRKLESHLM